jgi:hypothetical protein
MHAVQTLQKMNTTDAVSPAVFQVHQLDCSLHIAIPLQDLVIFLTSLFTSPSHFIFHSPLQALFGTPTSCLRSSLRWDEESSEDEDEDSDVDLYHFRTIEPVDQLWFSKLVSNSLLATTALQYAISKNIPAGRQQGIRC